MIKLPGVAAASLLCAFPAAIQAQDEAQEEMETVLVTGEQPGPGLWKVSRDGHVMWVLGSFDALPDTLVWKTKEVEARIAESQEVLYPGWPRVGLKVGGFQALTLVPAAFKAAKNPDGQKLQDVLSSETYATWLRLKQKYLGDDDDIEKYRPMIAQEKLINAIGKTYAMKGLRMWPADAVVEKAAKKHGVRINRLPHVIHSIEIEKPRAILKAARNLDLAEGECVGRNFARIEQADAMGLFRYDVAAANAWATGDLEAMRAKWGGSPPAELQREDCETAAMIAAMNSAELPAEMRRGIDLIKQQEELSKQAGAEAESNWLAAAEAALARNESTFAVLPINLVFNKWVYLGKLAKMGYLVEAPGEYSGGSGPTSENAVLPGAHAP